MIDIILIGIFTGSLGLVGLGLWGFKRASTRARFTIEGHSKVSIKTLPTHTIIANKGDKPIRVRFHDTP
tara:strand:+ start:489 stop:695 length:207 start_codon:yes stop_codon:yes gene_type:complete